MDLEHAAKLRYLLSSLLSQLAQLTSVPMIIDVVFCPSALGSVGDLSRTIVVVIDVLRASTTMCSMLSQGVRKIVLAENTDTALRLWKQLGDSSIILAGEKGGLRPQGFELGNSPLEVLATDLVGRSALYATTNGTRMLRLTQLAQDQIIACFANRHSAQRWVYRKEHSQHPPERLLLCCSGNDGQFSLEDSFFAGLFVSRYIANGFGHELTDAALAAVCIVNSYNLDFRILDHQASHARILRAYGFSGDVDFCLSDDRFDVVPVCRDGIVTNNS